MQEKFGLIDSAKIRTLIDTALGKEKADMVVANADLVNVYSGELLKGWSVAVKGDRIAYVGEKAEHTIGRNTRIIDATGKTLAPGFIEAHTHLAILCHVDEYLKYIMRGVTTTVVSETIELAIPLGYRGVRQFLKAISNQPVKVFATVAPALSLNPSAPSEILQPDKLRRLLKQRFVVGLGETPWQFIMQDSDNLFKLYAETLNSGKSIEGHGAGARGEKLAAYVAAGISSCHESTTVEEALERLRLGLHVMIREGAVRRELEVIAGIKDEPIDFRRLILCVDGTIPDHLMEHGYMEFVVQKAIDLGFNPVVAIQMVTLNAAEHFHLDNLIGGIAPGKYADMVILPDLENIRAETVISNGQIISRNGQILVAPRKHTYSVSSLRSVRLTRKLKDVDFEVKVKEEDKPVTVRVINQITPLVTREEQMTMVPREGLLKADVEMDILKVAFLNRTNNPGKMFTGFIKGFGMRKGALASSATWSIPGIVVVGAKDDDMAGAVNRVKELHGGAVMFSEGEVLVELPMPIAGYISDMPIELVNQRYEEIQKRAADLGVSLPHIHLTLVALSTNVIPFLRICESGLMDIGKGELVDLIV